MTVKSIRDIFVDALALKQQGFTFGEIADRLTAVGYANGFASIIEARTDKGVELRFDNAGVVHFDGDKWDYRNTVS